MGCCFSNDDDKDTYRNEEADERTRLLNSPVSNNTARSSDYNTPVPTTSQKENQQSALDRILQKTARKVIDVSAVDIVEQTEYHDRSRQYSNRVNMVLGGSGKIRNYRPSLPNGVNVAPQTVLSAPPVSLTDIKLISSAAEKAAKAVRDVKVTHKEDLVVPFGVPS